MDKSSSVTLSKSRSTVVAGNATNVGVDASRMKQPWLSAWRDPVAGVKAFPQCVRLSDIYGDGDHRLVIGDAEKTLVIYQGANIDKKYPIADAPTAVATFYAEQAKIPQPCIAVAIDSNILILKNFKGIFRLDLPVIPWNEKEVALWQSFQNDLNDIDRLVKEFASLKQAGKNLSPRAVELLLEGNKEKQLNIIAAVRKGAMNTPNSVTCMETLKKNVEDETAISMLVIGAESRDVFITENTGMEIIKSIKVPGTPAFLDVNGTFQSEYRIVVLTRESRGYVIKNGELTNTIIELESKPCGVCRIDKNIYIACMDKNIHCYATKNFKKSFSIAVPDYVTNIETMEYGRTKALKGFLVALANRELRIYNEKQLIDIQQMEDVALTIRFGTFGREENVLIIFYKEKGIHIKILQRQFNLNTSNVVASQLEENEAPLNMPKKTKLFVEQAQRERDQSTGIYRTFMKDLIKLRLKTTQSYLKSLQSGLTQGTDNSGISLRLHASVDGLGPLFKIRIKLENLGLKPAYKLRMSYIFDSKIYKLNDSPMTLPVLVPNISYPIDIIVQSIDPSGANDTVKIILFEFGKNVPVLNAVIAMPVSELQIE